MPSSGCDSDVSDGSGTGRVTRRSKDADATRDKGPKWACSKATFQEWYWETQDPWDAMGLHKTYTGKNRADAESADDRVRARYEKLNRKLFRTIIRQLERDSIQAKKMSSVQYSECSQLRACLYVLGRVIRAANLMSTK